MGTILIALHSYKYTHICVSFVSIHALGLTKSGIKVFGVGLKMSLLPLQLNIHVTHESTKETSDKESTSIGFILGDGDAGDEFVLDLYYDSLYGSIIFQTVGKFTIIPLFLLNFNYISVVLVL